LSWIITCKQMPLRVSMRRHPLAAGPANLSPGLGTRRVLARLQNTHHSRLVFTAHRRLAHSTSQACTSNCNSHAELQRNPCGLINDIHVWLAWFSPIMFRRRIQGIRKETQIHIKDKYMDLIGEGNYIRSYFANSSVPASMSSLASRIVSYPTSTSSVFGCREELAMPATSWSLPNNSKSCDALGLESKQQQAAWLARMCPFPCQKLFWNQLEIGFEIEKWRYLFL